MEIPGLVGNSVNFSFLGPEGSDFPKLCLFWQADPKGCKGFQKNHSSAMLLFFKQLLEAWLQGDQTGLGFIKPLQSSTVPQAGSWKGSHPQPRCSTLPLGFLNLMRFPHTYCLSLSKITQPEPQSDTGRKPPSVFWDRYYKTCLVTVWK